MAVLSRRLLLEHEILNFGLKNWVKDGKVNRIGTVFLLSALYFALKYILPKKFRFLLKNHGLT